MDYNHRVRILIVDDEHSNRVVLSRLCEARGHTVLLAASAEEALALLPGESFALILLDLSLPGRTGLEALGEIKRASGAFVALATGRDDEDTRRDAELLGADAFLPKPVEPAALDAVLARAAARPARPT